MKAEPGIRLTEPAVSGTELSVRVENRSPRRVRRCVSAFALREGRLEHLGTERVEVDELVAGRHGDRWGSVPVRWRVPPDAIELIVALGVAPGASGAVSPEAAEQVRTIIR